MTLKVLMCSFLFVSVSTAAAPARLAVVNKADGTASVFNLESNTQEFTVNVGYFPHEVIASPDGDKIFVSNYGKDHVRSTSPENRPGSTVSVIDLNAGVLTKDLQLGIPPCAPHGMVTSNDGRKLYVTCEDRQAITVMDLQTQAVLYSIPTRQEQSHMMVISPDETRAYIANFSPGTVTVLDLVRRAILQQIVTGPGTEGIGLAADGRTLFATAVLGSTLFKIDTETFNIIQSVRTDRSPIRVTPTPDGKYVLINSSATGNLLVYDTATLRLVKRIPVGRQPIGLSVPNSNFAYVAAMRDNLVAEIDLQRLEVSNVYATGNKPDGLTYIPAH
jgi:YVTN family beta-propeller protein